MKSVLIVWMGLLLSFDTIAAGDDVQKVYKQGTYMEIQTRGIERAKHIKNFEKQAREIYEELKKEYFKNNNPDVESNLAESKSEDDDLAHFSETEKQQLKCIRHAGQKIRRLGLQKEWILQRYKEKREADQSLPHPFYIGRYVREEEEKSLETTVEDMKKEVKEIRELAKKKED